MTTKITMLLVALLLVPGCVGKKAEKPKDAGVASTDRAAAETEAAGQKAGEAPDHGAARAEDGDGGPGDAGAAVDAGGRGPNGRLGGYIADDGGIVPQPKFGKIPDVPKTLVITISMGAEDYDVMINPDKTQWRIPMTAKPRDLMSLAQRARTAPEAIDGQVAVFLGNSVDSAVGQSMVEALKAAGFKKVDLNLPRRP